MAKKVKRTSTKRRPASVKVRSGRRGRKEQTVVPRVMRFAMPIVILLFLIGGLAFMSLSGYQAVTASSFFELRRVDVRGIDRTSREDIERVVRGEVAKPGVWNADLAEAKVKLEKFPFVKSVSVSRSLPSGIRVDVVERVPVAAVQLKAGVFLVDAEGNVLVPVKTQQTEFPFVMQGWDESKTEKAIPDNVARLKVYKKMVDEAEQFDVAARVKEFDLANPRQPVVWVEDSGRPISVSLARNELGKSLKTALDAIAGKGAKIRSVDSGGVHPIIQFLEF